MENIRDQIIDWNIKFPYDRAWRKKYNIPFNSSDHMGISFLDQIFDLEEDKLFEELSSEDQYIPNTGDWLTTGTGGSVENEIALFREEFKDIE